MQTMNIKKQKSNSLVCIFKNLFFVLFILLMTSCTSRKFTIQTKPDHVLCEINGRQLGFTPIEIKYVENGTFRIHLSKEGYENYEGNFKLKKKWVNIFCLDFIGEISPFHWVDLQHLEFSLKPIQPISHDAFKKQIDEQNKKKSN